MLKGAIVIYYNNIILKEEIRNDLASKEVNNKGTGWDDIDINCRQ